MQRPTPRQVPPQALIHWLGGCASPLPTPGPLGTTIIGRLGQLESLQLEGPIASAAAVARKLARTGQPALLIADDPDGTRRMVCSTVPPVRPAIVLPSELED